MVGNFPDCWALPPAATPPPRRRERDELTASQVEHGLLTPAKGPQASQGSTQADRPVGKGSPLGELARFSETATDGREGRAGSGPALLQFAAGLGLNEMMPASAPCV